MPKQPKAEIRKIEMFPAQYDFYTDNTHRFVIAAGGIQSGKSYALAHIIRRNCYEHPEEDGLILAPTWKILTSSTLRKFFSMFPQFRAYYHEMKGEIQLPTSGIIYCRSTDSPEGFAGVSASWVVADELGQMSNLAWQMMKNRVAMTGGRIWGASTPYNMNNFFYNEIYVPWRDGKDKDIGFYTWKSTDNPKFSTEFFESERQRLRPEAFSRTYCGKFEKMTGLVFNEIPPESIIDPTDILSHTEARICGVDFGYSDSSALTIVYVVRGMFYLVDEWKQSKRTTAEIIQVCKNKMSEHKINMFFPDSAEPDRAEEMRRAALPVYETNKDVKGGISLLQQLFRERRLLIFNRCKDFMSEAEQYHYPEEVEGKDSKDIPVKFNDHICDALRYAVMSYQPLKPRPMIATEGYKPDYLEQIGW
jgi:phage terminase large subunit